MRPNRSATAVLVLLGAVAVGCGFGRSGGDVSGSGADTAPSVVKPTSAGPRKSTPSPQAPKSTGTVQVTFRGTSGTDTVRCSAVNSELAVSANGGPIAWSAKAYDRPSTKVPHDGTPIAKVTFDPPSGTLESGESAVVRIRGSFSGSQFYVEVSAPNNSGFSAVTVPFTCR